MITCVSGILTEIDSGTIVVETGGLGFSVFVPESLTRRLPPLGSEIRVYTHFSVSEDSQSLYGFLEREDREMFKKLIRVSGVGPKGALAILSVLSPDELRMAVATGDARTISRAQGIGAKIAQRVILDLKDKLGSPSLSSSGLTAADMGVGSARESTNPVTEALEALVMLGYSRTEAGRAIAGLQLTADMGTEEILRAALRNIRV